MKIKSHRVLSNAGIFLLKLNINRISKTLGWNSVAEVTI